MNPRVPWHQNFSLGRGQLVCSRQHVSYVNDRAEILIETCKFYCSVLHPRLTKNENIFFNIKQFQLSVVKDSSGARWVKCLLANTRLWVQAPQHPRTAGHKSPQQCSPVLLQQDRSRARGLLGTGEAARRSYETFQQNENLFQGRRAEGAAVLTSPCVPGIPMHTHRNTCAHRNTCIHRNTQKHAHIHIIHTHKDKKLRVLYNILYKHTLITNVQTERNWYLTFKALFFLLASSGHHCCKQWLGLLTLSLRIQENNTCHFYINAIFIKL